MNISQLLNHLKETYSFSEAECQAVPGESLSDFILSLNEEQIDRFIQKADRLNSIVESCANMISICEPELKPVLMATTVRCQGSNQLKIRTSESMLKMLVEALFD